MLMIEDDSYWEDSVSYETFKPPKNISVQWKNRLQFVLDSSSSNFLMAFLQRVELRL